MRSALLARAVVAALLPAAWAGTAWADDTTLLKTADPQMIFEIAHGFGSAELSTDSDGDPMLTGRIQGVKYSVYFYDCQDHKDCNSIEFSLGYTDTFTADQANKWNAQYRWIKAYMQDGSTFEMDVDFGPGITRAYLEEQFSRWESFVPDIRDFINGKGDGN